MSNVKTRVNTPGREKVIKIPKVRAINQIRKLW